MKKQKEKISYKPKSYRLHKGTIELLKMIANENPKWGSWNKVFYNLISEHINKNKNMYRIYFQEEYTKYRKDKCVICGKENKLLIHHKDGNMINSNINNLETLCNVCHGKQYPK